MGLIQFVTFIMGLLQLSPAVYTCTADHDPCGDFQPFYGKALTSHVFQTLKVPSSLHCLKACNNDVRCQSFNHVMGKDTCELNNRSKEAKPQYFISDSTKLYMKRPKNRVPLGCTPEVPADSCKEIKASEGEQAVSGKYWRNSKGSTFQAYCHIETVGKEWTLIARFSNNDTKNWMEDSGDWWYDKNVADGETADPSSNTDMISPAFWLVSGNEFKITRSDDSQHSALLQTTGDCLGGQTFRSKITNYGDFRNGKTWRFDRRCLGNCTVQYGGQYETTKGFSKANCNDTVLSANKIGFWCDRGSWDGSVIMIGGAGINCGRAFSGIGITAAKVPSFASPGRSEEDTGDSPYSHGHTRDFSLNLWIR